MESQICMCLLHGALAIATRHYRTKALCPVLSKESGLRPSGAAASHKNMFIVILVSFTISTYARTHMLHAQVRRLTYE